ncbi:MAG: 2-C-methyl-D-erythritol 2,4-cyclodiphosphate synthase, partial [Acidobacteriales bacterium]|nr:2-C-methyl-D-erythritol 2,4-cyclodiphosphate synthase [Terriglobales bacterium]
KGADSRIFVAHALRLVKEQGYEIANVDSTLVLERPKIGPVAATIQRSVADILGVDPDQVGIKAKTPEGLGWSQSAVAYVAVLLVRPT